MKRRRLILGVLCIAAVGWGGWQWWVAPQIDSRLVGDWWRVPIAGETPKLFASLRASGEIGSPLKPNPTLGALPTPGTVFHRQKTITWSVRNNRLSIERTFVEIHANWDSRLHALWYRLWNEPENLTGFVIRQEYLIEEIMGDRLVLRQIVDGHAEPARIELNRVDTQARAK